jgi:hypothetical protein
VTGRCDGDGDDIATRAGGYAEEETGQTGPD